MTLAKMPQAELVARIREANVERDRILMAMDIPAAKQFIASHGGYVPRGNIDWTRVLHLARFEATSLPEEHRTASHIWLAQNGAQSLMDLPRESPSARAALDLIFPNDLTEEFIRREIGRG